MSTQKNKKLATAFLRVVLLLLAFLIGVQWMALSFKLLNRDILQYIVFATNNPFSALFIGILVTALMQSSSTVTTILVAMVASGTFPLESAVYMVMGANIGTTITSTFVSLGHVTRRKEFRKAIAAATVHDFFNIFTAMLLLPLEFFFGLLSQLSTSLAKFFYQGASTSYLEFLSLPSNWQGRLIDFLQSLIGPYPWLSLIISLVFIFISIKLIGQVFKSSILDNSPNRLEENLFKQPVYTLFFGTFITGLLQSSSLVTSLAVPIVANNRLSIKKAFPFIMGANIGTTLTALLAALSESEAALSIALSHVLFNVLGVLFLFPFPRLRILPIRLARYLGKATLKNRLIGFTYVMVAFFVIPFLLILMTRGQNTIRQYDLKNEANLEVLGQVNPFSDVDKRRSSSQTLLYRVDGNSDSLPRLSKSSEYMRVHQSKDTLMIDNLKFLDGSAGDCWQGQDLRGTYQACLVDKLDLYPFPSSIKTEACWIYSKEYSASSGAGLKIIYYLDIHRNLILRQEMIGKNGETTAVEELICVL